MLPPLTLLGHATGSDWLSFLAAERTKRKMFKWQNVCKELNFGTHFAMPLLLLLLLLWLLLLLLLLSLLLSLLLLLLLLLLLATAFSLYFCLADNLNFFHLFGLTGLPFLTQLLLTPPTSASFLLLPTSHSFFPSPPCQVSCKRLRLPVLGTVNCFSWLAVFTAQQ